MTATCLWLSRHPPLQAQSRELERLFSGHRFLWDPELFVDVHDIAERIAAARKVYGEPVEVVMVAPLTLIQKVIERGIRPLWAVMREVVSDHPAALEWFDRAGDLQPAIIVPESASYYRAHTDSCVLAPRGRVLEFVKFRRLVGIHMEFEEL